MHEEVIEDTDLPDELLYGRAGYLFAIQFLEFHLVDQSCVDTRIAEKVILKGCSYFFFASGQCALLGSLLQESN